MTAGVSSPVRLRFGSGASPGIRPAWLAVSSQLLYGGRLPSATSYERFAGVDNVLNDGTDASPARGAAGVGSLGRERKEGLA